MRNLATSHHYLTERGYTNITFDQVMVYAVRSNVTYFGSADKVSAKGTVIKGEWGKVQ